MAFSSQPSNLITVSYDGSARSMDLGKAVFDEVQLKNVTSSNRQSDVICHLQTFKTLQVTLVFCAQLYRSAVGLRSFDFMSSDRSTLLIADWGGDVAVVDRRTPG